MFSTSLYYPGVLGQHAPARTARSGETTVPRTVHPVYLDMREDFEPPLDPRLPIGGTTSHQGTIYQFPTTTHSVIRSRAWHLDGFETIDLSGEFRFPNDLWREDNDASPFTPWLGFAATLNVDLTPRKLADSCILAAPTPVSGIGRAGVPSGLLSPNINVASTLGSWRIPTLLETYTTIYTEDVSSVDVWNSGGTSFVATAALRYTVEAAAFGNTSLLRFRAGELYDGAWTYPSIFWLRLRATLGVVGPAGLYVGADGESPPNPDQPPDYTSAEGVASTRVDGFNLATVAECGLVSMPAGSALLPSAKIYRDTAAVSDYRVPWTQDASEYEVVGARTEARNLVVEFSDLVTVTLPDDI